MPVTPAASAAAPAASVTATARRAQIVAATIEVIAETGFPQASFARIADRAGLSSTRLISYHFAGKDDLIAAVVQDVVGSISRYMSDRVRAEHSAEGMLRAYIEGNVEFISTHRAQMKALLEIVVNGAMRWTGDTHYEVTAPLEEILRKGQADGVFRDFDPRVVASTVQRSIEALPLLLDSVPDLDCPAYARELVTLFDLGTRRAAT